ncbi:Phenylacetaldehyde reductase [Acropora cervicornis]|uniref:Phenylacetaldehyde reductase n=1 Tax=Acropora cervicornis TaxID=6130 RepID=A0AAD9Q042_ACRCE|nr:Phenylacetaldehyde reductase [Acropora cervicornis]
MEVIRPAVEGTKNVLEACAKTKGGVKRVVLTSSTAAICGGRYDEGIVFSEKEWASEEASSPYGKSKLQAEKTAWELVENLPDDEKFELCTINPGFILGPILQGTLCTSMEREVPMVPNLCYPACDVRDVAGAHITAMTSPTAPGRKGVQIGD